MSFFALLCYNKSWIVYLLPVGTASSSRSHCPPGCTDQWWSPAGTGVHHRSPQTPDMAPGMHLNLQNTQQCIPVLHFLDSKYWASCSLTPSIFVAEVREPPHVAQSDNISCHSQEKLHLTAPVSSLLHLSLLVLAWKDFIQHTQNLSLNPIFLLTSMLGVQLLSASILTCKSVSCNEQLPEQLISSQCTMNEIYIISENWIVSVFACIIKVCLKEAIYAHDKIIKHIFCRGEFCSWSEAWLLCILKCSCGVCDVSVKIQKVEQFLHFKFPPMFSAFLPSSGLYISSVCPFI